MGGGCLRAGSQAEEPDLSVLPRAFAGPRPSEFPGSYPSLSRCRISPAERLVCLVKICSVVALIVLWAERRSDTPAAVALVAGGFAHGGATQERHAMLSIL